MKIFVFGNGNLSFKDFLEYYGDPVTQVLRRWNPGFIICDYKGVDTLMMELLKCETPDVNILHIGEKPRYMPDKYKTQVNRWTITGGFQSDMDRDTTAIIRCTHFLALDFNSDEKRKSGTLKNIEACLAQEKTDIRSLLIDNSKFRI